MGVEQDDVIKRQSGGQAETEPGRETSVAKKLPKDWIGRTFGSLTVVAYDGKRGGKHYWRCRCLCGGEKTVCQSNLKSGHTKSCGCLSNPAGTRHFVDGTCIESIRSRKVSASNNSGIRGVYRNKRTGRWAAQITFQGKTRYLGSFDSLEEAADAREQAERVFDEFLERHGGGQSGLRQASGGGPRGDEAAAAGTPGRGPHRKVASLVADGRIPCRGTATVEMDGRDVGRRMDSQDRPVMAAVGAEMTRPAAGGGYGEED